MKKRYPRSRCAQTNQNSKQSRRDRKKIRHAAPAAGGFQPRLEQLEGSAFSNRMGERARGVGWDRIGEIAVCRQAAVMDEKVFAEHSRTKSSFQNNLLRTHQESIPIFVETSFPFLDNRLRVGENNSARVSPYFARRASPATDWPEIEDVFPTRYGFARLHFSNLLPI